MVSRSREYPSIEAESREIAKSGLFDKECYLGNIDTQNIHAISDPIRHFLQQGASAGLAPTPLFDTAWYLNENPDVLKSEINPFLHYCRYGASEGRSPHPLFDGAWYLAQNQDVAQSGANPLAHFLTYGAAERRNPHPLFDINWYAAQVPALGNAALNPLIHYLTIGYRAGLDPHPSFSTRAYIAKHPDAEGQNPLMHYLTANSKSGFPVDVGKLGEGSTHDPQVDRLQLFIVDPSLNGYVGHHFEYDWNTAEAARRKGFDAIVLANLNLAPSIVDHEGIRPAFRRDMWTSSLRFDDWSEDDLLCCNREFYLDLVHGLDGVCLGSQTVIFGHMITARQLLAWAWFAGRFKGPDAPQIVLLFRYEHQACEGPIAARAFRMLESAAGKTNLRFATDSTRLARDYSRLTSLPFEIFPVPLASKPVDFNGRAQKPRGLGLRFAVLGNARRDKGILEIFEAIVLVAKSPLGPLCEFEIQCNDPEPDLRDPIDAFGHLDIPGVTLIREALSSADYTDVLERADVVLLPYWESIYISRTSGVFVEAVCAGKIVVCSAGTWLSDQLERSGAGVICQEKNHVDLALSIMECVENASFLQTKAALAARPYATFHNSDSLFWRMIKKPSA